MTQRAHTTGECTRCHRTRHLVWRIRRNQRTTICRDCWTHIADQGRAKAQATINKRRAA